jgi:single-strand DNA-binding protein
MKGIDMIFANQATLCGKVVKDPIFATTKSNKTVCKIILVVEKNIRSMKRSDYIPVAMWGKKAEIAKNLISKGDVMVVMGSISQERWETADHEKRSRIVVQADKFMMVPNKPYKNTNESDGYYEDDYEDEDGVDWIDDEEEEETDKQSSFF